jgi:glycosyltransferase involved in cell wall biosynthesis
LGVDPLAVTTQLHVADRPTFVTVGTIEARKNHWMLLTIWLRLIERLGDDVPRLIIIGQRGWEAQPVFEMLDRFDKLRGHVVELNRCSDHELARHVASARALLFPSLAEGFGLPLVEALGLGVPAIASDLPVFREIAGDIPSYLAPQEEAAWEAAILDYARAYSRTRAEQVERISEFEPPTWREHFARIESWLETLA